MKSLYFFISENQGDTSCFGEAGRVRISSPFGRGLVRGKKKWVCSYDVAGYPLQAWRAEWLRCMRNGSGEAYAVSTLSNQDAGRGPPAAQAGEMALPAVRQGAHEARQLPPEQI